MASDSRHLPLDESSLRSPSCCSPPTCRSSRRRRRAEVVQFVQRRAGAVPSFTRFGVRIDRTLTEPDCGARRSAVARLLIVEIASDSRRISAADPLAGIRLHLGALARHTHRPERNDDRCRGDRPDGWRSAGDRFGAGGATTAAVLAEAGFDVLIVEEGEWVDQGAVVPFSLEQMDRQYRSGGVTVALGSPRSPTPRVVARAAEPRSTAGCTAARRRSCWHRWARRLRHRRSRLDEVLSIADEVERAINVTTVPGPPSRAERRVASRCGGTGWQNSEIPGG